MKKAKYFSLTIKFVILFGVILLVTNTVLGAVLMYQSTSIIQALVRKSMLNISNTAAGILDGDELEALTEEDVGSPAYVRMLNELNVFQNNVDIEFIYAVRRDGEDRYVFIMDPDPVEPGEYGEEIVVTNALREAAKGTAAVDEAPVEDKWGDFYSAYSPVFDSVGNVAGIVGVDFNSEWYQRQIREHTLSIGIISLLSIFAGGFVMVLITNRIRKRFQVLSDELSVLSSDIDILTEEITSNPGYAESITYELPPEASDTALIDTIDEIEELGAKMHHMHREMKRYLEYLHAKSYTDALTGVKNTTAYQEYRESLDEKIRDHTADFCITVFDINNLKQVNDRYGHACGDRIIKSAASCIVKKFRDGQTFRIGGDEFLTVSENTTGDVIREQMSALESLLSEMRAAQSEDDAVLSISSGMTVYRPGLDHSFQEVFVRADEIMYQNKREFYSRSEEE